jgi:hypothetical protein
MATTTNFGWETPDDTDLVKDGALAMRTLGNSIDSSFVDLKGGTTGQVLAKASNTDLDFSWVAVDPLTILDAKGDLISATAADTPARLAVGTNGQVLTVDSTTATGLKWASPAGGGKVLQVVQGTLATRVDSSSTTYADTGLSASITPASASNKVLVIVSHNGCYKNEESADNGLNLRLLRGATTLITLVEDGGYTATSLKNAFGSVTTSYLDSPATTSSTTYKTQLSNNRNGGAVATQYDGAPTSTIILMEIGA